MRARPEPPAPEKPKNTDLIETTAPDDPLQRHLQHLVPAEVSESIPPTSDPPFPTLSFASLMTGMAEYTYGGPPYSTVSRPYSPPLSVYPSALGEMASSGTSRSSGSGSYSSDLTSVPRSMRYNPIGVAPSVVRSGRGRIGRPTKHGDPTNNDRDPIPAHGHATSPFDFSHCTYDVPTSRRRQEIHRLQIESEQGRRDEFRASYLRFKDAVPTHGLGLGSRQKLGKVVLLDRATTSINSLEKSRQQLLAKIREVEEEGVRLRQANEALALSSVAERPAPAPSPP
ncbi:hypothetical protein EDB85DRAFT_1954923 [Lactarius pseudohatsudake]|nr:hypothetical protein EDB85DRAFT_1954923 [Lactarius pseudohatsudake]